MSLFGGLDFFLEWSSDTVRHYDVEKPKVKSLVMPETKKKIFFFSCGICAAYHGSCKSQKLPGSTELVN